MSQSLEELRASMAEIRAAKMAELEAQLKAEDDAHIGEHIRTSLEAARQEVASLEAQLTELGQG